MNFKFRITKYLAVSALAVLLLGACSKNNIYMDVAYPNGEENSDGEEGTHLVTSPSVPESSSRWS